MRELTSLIFPYHCLICKRVLRSRFICISCHPGLPRLTKYKDEQNQSAIYKRYFLWPYSKKILNLIRTLKYQRQQRLAQEIAKLSIQDALLLSILEDSDVLIPVPSPRKTLFKRGFNQTACILHQIRKAHIEHLPPLSLTSLIHRGYKQNQASLRGHQRFANVANSFSANSKALSEKRVILFDDVVTSGATAELAARALTDAGASQVILLSLTLSGSWREFSWMRSQFLRTLHPLSD